MAINRSLFAIEAEYLKYLDELEQYFLDNPDAEGELPDEFNDRLNINIEEAGEKIEAYYYAIESLKADMALLKEQEQRLYMKRKAKEKAIEKVKGYAARGIKLYGTVARGAKNKSVKTGNLSASFVTSPKVVVTDINRVDYDLRTYDLNLKRMPNDLAIKVKEVLTAIYPDFVKFGFEVQLESNPDTKAMKALAETEAINPDQDGFYLDKEAGYVRFS